MLVDVIPYCGPPPSPATVLGQWNLDPLATVPILALAAWALLLRRGDVAEDRPSERRARSRAAMLAALVLFAAFVSPLCALASALFGARVLHHLFLVALAAPLLALALPAEGARSRALPLALPVILHAATMWFWHAPLPYLWALSSHAGYWVMEMTLLLPAVWLWRGILSPRRPAGPAVAATLATMIQMGMLGALLVFASDPLYVTHLASTAAFGLTPVEDQQLAGILMWVPAALPYIAAAVWRLWPLLGDAGGDDRSSASARNGASAPTPAHPPPGAGAGARAPS